MPLQYRPVQRTDLPALGSLYAAMVQELGLTYPQYQDPAAELIAQLRGEDAFAWIGEVAVPDALPDGFGNPSGGTPVGVLFAHLETRSCGGPKRVGSAEWLYVRPEHRASTVAPTLMRRAIRRAKAAGCEVIEATFVPGTEQARRWHRFGFQAPYVGRAVLAAGRYAALTRD